MYHSTKIIEGFSTCFRQWKAVDTHCSKIHGYAIKFKMTFQSEDLDSRNWVVDFGIFSRSTFKFDGLPIKDWFKYMFDHTLVVSADDPILEDLIDLQAKNAVQLRILNNGVGCEKFALLVYNVVFLMISNDFKDSEFKPTLLSVECVENEKNSAVYAR